MTKNPRIAPCILAALLLGSSGCATILKGGSTRGQVQFRNTPLHQDESLNLKVWIDGQATQPAKQFSKIVGDVVYSEPTVDLDTAKKPVYAVKIQNGGCQAEFNVSRSVSGWWVVLDIFVGLGVGVIVDWATGAWYEFGDQSAVYVPALMQRIGKPVDGVTPVIPCGTAAPAASAGPRPNS